MKAMMITLALLVMGGCATLNTTSYESKELSAAEMRYIAQDSSQLLAEHYPAGKTTLHVLSAGEFGASLAEALRQQGFAVQDAAGQGAVELNYILDGIAPDRYRLGLITPQWRSDRLYQRSSDRLISSVVTQRLQP